MILHYLKSTLRYISRTTLYSILNLSGLVIGLTASAMMFIYVWDELRYDRFHSDKDNIFRIITVQNDGTRGVTTPGPLGENLLERNSQIKELTRVGKWSGAFKVKEDIYEESEVYFVDNSFFRVFDFPIIKGDPAKALKNSGDIVITDKIATKFFGSDWMKRSDIIGQIITMNGNTPFTIVAIAENPPSFSSIQFDYLLSFEYMKGDRWSYQWGSHNFHTYVKLHETTDAKTFETQIRDALKGTEFNEGFSLEIQPLEKIYMESFASYDWGKHGNPQYVFAFAVIGFFVLAIACFNYINLTTSQAVRRAKEIGIRKVNGATRINIFFQFMGESTMMVVCAALISRALVDLLLPYFNELSGKNFVIESFQYEIAILFVAMTVITSFLAGIYPAITLARLRSLNMIRNVAAVASGAKVRRILVTVQLSIALVLITATIVIFGQIEYMQNRDLGFDSDELVYIKLAGSLKGKNATFKEEISKLNYVKATVRSTTTLANTDNGSYIEWPGKKEGAEVSITQMNVDSDFINALNIKLLTGRDFSSTDSTSYMLNETAIKAMGITKEEALGMKVKFWGTEGTVIAVVNDFHFRPMHYQIAPLIIRHNEKENFYQLLVKVDEEKIDDLKSDAWRIFKTYEENFPFSYGIVDESIESQYKTEERVSRVASTFSGLAVLISLLGIIGLISHAIHERQKEFSIRKILGLPFRELLLLLSQKLLVSYVVAIIVAMPVAYILVSKWLQNFTYTTTINPGAFILSNLLVFGLALLIILIQAWKQMRKRALDALRTE